MSVRFIEINGDRLTGNGTFQYVIGFRCRKGVVRNVFQQEGEGVGIVNLSPESVVLSFAVWKPSDPHCCPTEEKKVWFSWDAVGGTY